MNPRRFACIVVTGMLMVAAFLWSRGALIPMALIGVLCIPLERLSPRRRIGLIPRGLPTDAAHVIATTTMTAIAMGAVISGLALLPIGGIAAPLIDHQPLLLRAAETLLAAELGYYAVHRLQHRSQFLWRFHVIHHSSEDLYWLAAARAHPIDQLLQLLGAFLPVYLLGNSAVIVAAYGTAVFVQNFIVHSNVSIPVGPLRWIIATPDFHHLHHARDQRFSNANFASQFPIIDLVFGSLRFPRDSTVSTYGVNESIPRTYLGQLAYPSHGAMRIVRFLRSLYDTVGRHGRRPATPTGDPVRSAL